MREVPISRLRGNLPRILEQARKTIIPIRVTHCGKSLAEIVPPSPGKRQANWLGCMAGTIGIVGFTGSLGDWR